MTLARLYIELDGITIQGEGVVQVTGAPEGDRGPMIAAFLASVDPAAVEQAALDRQGWGSGSLAAAIVQVLAELATGKPAGT